MSRAGRWPVPATRLALPSRRVTQDPAALTPERRRRLRRRVLEWYGARGRPLAFRRTSDPWAILVAEVMAQQTQAGRAAEAWERFMARWPTPADLAAASPADVVRAWRGLGYNRRAIALHRCATTVAAEHGGHLPSDVEALQRLPGVGPYTARAVAALAFGRRVGAVDTNVRRVLGRAFFGTRTPDATALQAVADELVPARNPGGWTHALMDVGATVCRIRDPRCDACPLRTWCVTAAAAGVERSAATHGAADSSRRARAGVPFRRSSRWLRGRILDTLRDGAPGEWVVVPRMFGDHPAAAVETALAAMARDGLLDPGPGRFLARLPSGRPATLRA